MSGIAEAFLSSAARHRDRPALWVRNETLTYAQLRAKSASIASALIVSNRVCPGDRVAILSNRTVTAYSGVIAALLAGAAYVPLNPRFPAERNRAILTGSGASALVIDDHNVGILAQLLEGLDNPPFIVAPESAELPLQGKLLWAGRSDLSSDIPDSKLRCGRADADLAYIMFTSGSTGVPKGVPISHGNLAAYVANATALGGVTEEDRIIQLADLSFDISVHDMFVSWLNGAMLCSVPENATLMATRFVDELKITGWFSVPSTAGLLKQANFLSQGAMPSMRFTFFCGEALTVAVADAWAAAAPNAAVFNLYGPTEATVAFSAFRCRPGQFDPSMIVPLGDAFDGQSIRLFEVDSPLPAQGDVGEICLSGTQVCAEYWKAPDLTARRFFSFEGNWWYRTGDLGRIDLELGFLFAGRADHQVKIRGFRVELQEIEGVVRRASGRDIVAVIPWPATADGGATGCVAFVAGQTGDERFIRDECQRLLPDYMVPSRVIFLAEMPLNSNGKVDYLRLKNHQALSA